MAIEGFTSYNKFKKSYKELKQLYDLTFHLYIQENERIAEVLPTLKPPATITTKVGLVDHSLVSLYQLTQKKYPKKLRQLLLISSITTLEVYFTDLMNEIFNRESSPFEEQTPIQFIRALLIRMFKKENTVTNKDD
jgi:hypothetical protein